MCTCAYACVRPREALFCERNFCVTTLKTLRNKFYKTRDQDLWYEAFLLADQRKLEPDELVLAWIFCQAFCRTTGHPHLMSAPSAVSFCKDLKKILEMYGCGFKAAESIRVVFEELKWVDRDHLNFMLNLENHNRFIIPAMAKKKQVKRMGEQSEWVGERTVDASCVELSFE